MQRGVPMRHRPAVRRTKSDADRIEQITSLKTDRGVAHVVELDLDVRPWLAGTVVSAVQVEVLDGTHDDSRASKPALRHRRNSRGPGFQTGRRTIDR
jgi:hypothetical protein